MMIAARPIDEEAEGEAGPEKESGCLTAYLKNLKKYPYLRSPVSSIC